MIVETLSQTPRGSRTRAVSRLASLYGVSEATVWRAAAVGGKKRKRSPQRPSYRDWTRSAVAIAHRAPRPVPLDLAIRAGLESGELPPEAAAMPVATARRIAREELGLRRPKRRSRMRADYPMQAVQIDGSSYEHLVPLRRLESADGDDWLLRLHRRPYAASGYKNKPLGPDRHRVLIYALWDMCTGYIVSRYTVARGEDALGAIDFLCWALEDRDDARAPLCGIPDDLWTDHGPLFKSAAAADLLRRLGIALVNGAPYEKERMGGVERSHRTRWSRFERSLFLRAETELSLGDLNSRLAEFEARENANRPSRTKVAGRTVSRTAAWVALTNGRPTDNPLRRMPENPMRTLTREARRRVDIAGIVRWQGREYEVEAAAAPRFVGRGVIARHGLAADADRDALVIEDLATGERALAHPYRPRAYGDIRSAPATPLERLTEADVVARRTARDVAGADLFDPRRAKAPSGLLSIPARTSDADPLDDPLRSGCYEHLDQAMRALVALYPHRLSPANRAAAAAYLERHRLARSAVVELANRLLGLNRAAR